MLRLRPALRKMNCVSCEIAIFSQSQFTFSQIRNFSQSILQPCFQHRLLRNLQEIDFSGRKEFPSYLPILVDFNSHCNQLTGVNGPIVQHMKSETQKYLNRFHEERRQRLTLLLDNEEWRAAEVPKELQEAVDHVLLQVGLNSRVNSEKFLAIHFQLENCHFG